MDLEKLNQIGWNKIEDTNKRYRIVKLASLPPGTAHKILSAKMIPGPYGESVRLQLEQCAVCLPKRANDDFRPHLEQFENGKYGIISRGKDSSLGEKYETDLFEIVEIQ